MGWKLKRSSSIFNNKSQNFRLPLILQCITEILTPITQKITEVHFFRLRNSFARISNQEGRRTQLKRLQKPLITFRNSDSIYKLTNTKNKLHSWARPRIFCLTFLVIRIWVRKVSSLDVTKLTKRQTNWWLPCVIKKMDSISRKSRWISWTGWGEWWGRVLALSRSVTTAPSSSSFSTILCLLSRAASISGVRPLSCKGRKETKQRSV